MGRIVTAKRTQSDAGYFRIGNLILDIPPEQIQCHKVINSQEVLPLRFPFAIPVKTGQSRWDVTWAWKALTDLSADDPYAAWKDVQLLLAMFKAAPFVEVENEHIRQIVNPSQLNNGATADDAMAFALRQLRVDTVPDLADALQITMTMSLFNYRPYSANFQYDNGANKPASSALNSKPFGNYLQKWIQDNLMHDPNDLGADGQPMPTVDWLNQTPGSLTMSWREYRAVPLPHTIPPPAGTQNPTPSNPSGTTSTLQSGFADNVFVNIADVNDPKLQWWVKAVIAGETRGKGGGYLTPNSFPDPTTGKTSSAFGIIQWVMAAAIDALKQADALFSTGYISTARQSGFLIPSKSPSGLTWARTLPSGKPLSADPQTATYWGWMSSPPVVGGTTTMQNNMATAWAFNLLKRYSGSVLKSWEADRFGPGTLSLGKADPSQDKAWFTHAVNNWRLSSNNPQDFAVTSTAAPIGQPVAKAPSTAITSGTNTNTNLNLSNSTVVPGQVPMTPMIRFLLSSGWVYDYATESAAFLYKEHWLKMTDQDTVHGDSPSSSDIEDIDSNHFVYPNQISVVFLNNIAQIPLASYQYPTYQHLGPVSTLVSIGLLSNADISPATDDYSEPEHTGLSLLSEMTSTLEDQFQRLRTEWRRVNSIHRMQAVSIKNQVLNLLGIRGVLTKELTTETVPDAANLVNAQYNAIQYENVFETSDPFRVTIVPGQLSQEWLKILRDGTLNQFNSDGSVIALTNLSKLMQKPLDATSQKFLYDWLTKADPAPQSQAFLVPTPTTFSGDEQSLLLKVLDEQDKVADEVSLPTFGEEAALAQVGAAVFFASLAQNIPDVANRIKTHSQLNYSDLFVIRNGIDKNIPDYALLQSTLTKLDVRIQQALANDSSFEPPINQLFDLYVAYAVANNVQTIRDQMVRVQNTPQLKDRFIKPDGTSTPGSISANHDHGCYRDFGIRQITLGGQDYTPAVYFYDDHRALTDTLKSQAQTVTTTTVKTAQAFANATPYADKTHLLVSNTESFSGNVSAIVNTIEPSSYTMKKAFPTFKLFLMEDNSNRPFYAYDNFYSYATVLEMEIIRYRDKPDEAVIQISDLMHLLDQHLYDSTPQGKFEKRLRMGSEVGLASGEALTGPAGAVGGTSINQAGGGAAMYDLSNQFPEIAKHDGSGDNKFPLKYFPLQTGTKIQIRMGFSNNPDLLTPVFTGQITQLEGDEILTITAQSYMLELINPTPDEIRSDGFAVDSFINNTANAVFKAARDVGNGNLLSVPGSLLSVFSNDAAYGGGGDVGGIRIPGIITPAGGAIDVISSMLHVSSAKHFGFWQPGAPTDPYLKGFSWQSAIGSVLLLASTSPLARGATGLESGYDRSFENILISHTFGPDGSAVADGNGSVRGWWYEKTAGYGSSFYHVPKDENLTPWTLIQDIARRYPEFILAVKQYGFPYTADATLVFANPHDFYSSRPPMPGEIETQTQAVSDNTTFFKWWSLGTLSGRNQFTGFCEGPGGEWVNIVLKQYDKSTGFTGDESVSTLGQIGAALGALDFAAGAKDGSDPSLRELTATQLANKVDVGGAPVFDEVTKLFISIMGNATSAILTHSFTNLPGRTVSSISAQQRLQQIIQNYINFTKPRGFGATDVKLNDRMKPVRRYHLVNGDNIIHNGMVMNEKFYNTVRLQNQTVKANAAIPSQYCRILNADPFMVDKKNIQGNPQYVNAYAQTFLRDEIAKLYRGELVLTGNPEIEPFDVLAILDPSTGISGPVEVDTVIHSFTNEVGFITIVKPRAFVIVNDNLSAPLYAAVWNMLTDVQGRVEGYASRLGVNAPGVELGLGLAIAAGGIAVGPWIAGAAALGGTMSLFWAGKEVQRLNPIGLVPLTRFERPWVGGLEGWRIDDLFGLLNTKWDYFKTQEIEPLIFSYRTARGMQLI